MGRGNRLRELPGPSKKESEPEVINVQVTYAERIRTLAKQDGSGSVIYQSLIIAAIQVLERVLVLERKVAEATMSLGQREKLMGMVATLEVTIDALRESLSEQGRQMLNMAPQKPVLDPSETNWWFTLTDAIQALEDGTGWITNLVSGQQKKCLARSLASIIVRLLHRHYIALLKEAESWIGSVA